MCTAALWMEEVEERHLGCDLEGRVCRMLKVILGGDLDGRVRVSVRIGGRVRVSLKVSIRARNQLLVISYLRYTSGGGHGNA